MNANLAGILGEPRSDPGATALIHEGATVSYADLAARAGERAAAVLAGYGVGPGDRVAVVLPNSPSFVEAFFGALRLGAIVVPFNVLLRPREIEERLAAVSASAVVFDTDRAPGGTAPAPRRGVTQIRLDAPGGPAADAPLVERDPDDPAAILFTSGTSGISKGAVLTHGSIGSAARNAAEALAFGPQDVVVGAAPFSHVLGQTTCLISTLSTGGAVAVVPRFDPVETLGLMVSTGTTVLLGVPTMCIALCDVARSAPALPRWAARPASVVRRCRSRSRAPSRTRSVPISTRGTELTGDLGDRDDVPEGSAAQAGICRSAMLGDTELEIVSPEGVLVPGGRDRRDPVPRLERDRRLLARRGPAPGGGLT